METDVVFQKEVWMVSEKNMRKAFGMELGKAKGMACCLAQHWARLRVAC